jgi:hypothetical protein
MDFGIPKIVITILLVIYICVDAQPNGRDTLDIRYEIVGHLYLQDKEIIKIKVPPFLSTAEVMEQVKLVLQWPGDPPPEKLTSVYVFRETDPVGEISTTGASFIPGKGIAWSLSGWKPLELSLSEPTIREKIIYNALLDTLFARGVPIDNMEIKKEIANTFGLTVPILDSIYFKVKYWKSY